MSCLNKIETPRMYGAFLFATQICTFIAMRSFLAAIFLTSAFFCKAQLFTIDTSFANTSSKQFFKQNPTIEKITFSFYSNGTNYLQVYKKGIWQDTSYNFSQPNDYESYNLGFVGDNYFFHKKFGTLPLPEKELAFISKNKCSEFSYARGDIYPDSIRFKIEYRCPVEIQNDTTEIVFTKIEVPWGYKNGIKSLQNRIQLSYQNNYLNKKQISTDSTFMFFIIVDRKEGCLLRIELTHGNYSSLAQFLIDELRTSCEWIPNMQGGRGVRSFTKIFIQLSKEGSFLVAMPNDQPEKK